ncbi:MAG: homoserine dehydrogenase [Geminicoccaceae bacterium]|nr:homoserine dehydrogenase [Geminicoccaceae bacterium]
MAASEPRPVAAILIGAGQFGTSLLAQARHVPGLALSVVCDRAIAALRRPLEEQGLLDDPAPCSSRSEALAALRLGRTVLVDDAELALELPADILIEATGEPAVAGANAARAIECGLHVAMVSKEADVTVGPALAARAAAADVVYTPVDGDQPSLLLRLIDRMRGLGFEIVAAGKSSEYDLIYTADDRTVRVLSERHPADGLDQLLDLGDAPTSTLEQRAALLSGVRRRGAPDFCEMGIVVNGAGLAVDRPDLHAPIVRPKELADVFCPARDGGLLGRPGVVDVFHALRAADEASFAGGVFVVVQGDHRPTFELLREKGHVVSRDGRYLAVYRPAHLLGVEAVGTILRAVRERRGTPGCTPRPVVDLAGRATGTLGSGTRLNLAERHEIDGLEPLLVAAGPLQGDRPVPFYLAAGRSLARPLEAGALLTAAHLEPIDDDPLITLRREQDQAFFA